MDIIFQLLIMLCFILCQLLCEVVHVHLCSLMVWLCLEGEGGVRGYVSECVVVQIMVCGCDHTVTVLRESLVNCMAYKIAQLREG